MFIVVAVMHQLQCRHNVLSLLGFSRLERDMDKRTCICFVEDPDCFFLKPSRFPFYFQSVKYSCIPSKVVSNMLIELRLQYVFVFVALC